MKHLDGIRTLDLAYLVWSAGIVDFEASYRAVAEGGVRCVVMDARRGNLALEAPEDAAEAGRILRRLGLSPVACHGLSDPACHLTVADGDARKEMLARHLNFMRNASDLGCRTYVFHIGAKPEGASRTESWDRVRRALDVLVPVARSLDILPAVENGFLPHALANDAEELAAFIEEYAPEQVGICYDSGHAHLREGAPAVLETLAPRVVTVHLHDNHGISDHHLIPGQGTIDWDAVTRGLSRCPRLLHVETEAANCAKWRWSDGIWPVRDVYARYCTVLNRPGTGIYCR